MNHDELKELLWEYLDGELEPLRAAEVKAHAAVCPECAARLEEMAFVSRAAGSALKRPCGDKFEEAVMAGVRARQAVPVPARRLFPRVDAARHFLYETLGLRRMAVAGACAAVLVVLLFYGRQDAPAPVQQSAAPVLASASASSAYAVVAYGGEQDESSEGEAASLSDSYERYFLSNTIDTQGE